MPNSERLTVVLLPGMHGTGQLFAEFVGALPESFQKEIVEYPEQAYLAYPALRQLVEARCPAADDFAIVAESFSAPLAIEIAAARSANLRSLVLYAGFAASPARRWRRLVAWSMFPLMFLFPIPGFAAKRLLLGRTASPTLLRAFKDAVSTVRSSVLARRLYAVLRCDVSEAATRINVSTLYIRPTNDVAIPAASVEDLGKAIPHLETADVDGGHLILQEQPHQTADVIAGFLRRRTADHSGSDPG